ncbi:MAG: methyltransferase domain-containing protein [Candidatus Scalindua sp.]|jgi:cyclopropane fatty-acyl-phospholipid synthase-like methyltransferase|nr:methyltransferase domain-containing protein [Candidatus Scalindua sp.]
MDEYLQSNDEFWQYGYEAENVESYVFRPYGIILKYELGIDGSKNEKLLEFGCGQGAACQFFKSKGFDVYGIDISNVDINRCQQKMPDIASHFEVIDPKPEESDVFFGGEYDVVVGIQSLYYYTNTDMQTRLISLYNQMRKGAVIYATMIGTKMFYYDYSTEYKDGLRKVDFSKPRIQVKDYFVNFTSSESELEQKFSMFKKLHIGSYTQNFREDEGVSFHYTFVGQKE